MTILSCDHLYGAPIYRNGRVIGHIRRLYLDSAAGTVETVELVQGWFKRPLFVYWKDLHFSEDIPRITLAGDAVKDRPVSLASYLEDTYRLVGFWGFWGPGS